MIMLLQAAVMYAFLNMLNAAGLLINSLDRLLVVWKPLFYFRFGTRIVVVLLAVGYIIALLPNVIAIIITLLEPNRNVHHFCL